MQYLCRHAQKANARHRIFDRWAQGNKKKQNEKNFPKASLKQTTMKRLLFLLSIFFQRFCRSSAEGA